jgi:hypothetical protein
VKNRNLRKDLSLFFDIPAILAISVIGLILLPLLGPFLLLKGVMKNNKKGHGNQNAHERKDSSG